MYVIDDKRVAFGSDKASVSIYDLDEEVRTLKWENPHEGRS